MSDTGYFLCLGAVIMFAIAYPVVCKSVARTRDRGVRAIAAVVAGVVPALGLGFSFPFAHTQEMSWVPAVAAGYFFGMGVAMVLYHLAEKADHSVEKTGGH